MNGYALNRLRMITAGAGIIGLLLLPFSLTAHERCDFCHLSPTPTEQQAELAGSLPSLCIDCHNDRAGGGEHAINIIPMGPTGNLPLVNGRLGCTTCHDPHATTPLQLRTNTNTLCMTCHQL